MLRQRYDPEVIRAELASGTIWWDVLREDGTMQAFASSFRSDPPGTLKLDKLYVNPARQRRGFGGELLRARGGAGTKSWLRQSSFSP